MGSLNGWAGIIGSDVSLAVLHFLFILLIGFYGFFRIDEFNTFRLHVIVVNTNHMTIYVAKRKNDQYREGHTSYLARSEKFTFSITEKILKVLPQSITLPSIVCACSAASNPACRGIPGDLLDMHAGWIKHTVMDRLTVSKALLL